MVICRPSDGHCGKYVQLKAYGSGGNILYRGILIKASATKTQQLGAAYENVGRRIVRPTTGNRADTVTQQPYSARIGCRRIRPRAQAARVNL